MNMYLLQSLKYSPLGTPVSGHRRDHEDSPQICHNTGGRPLPGMKVLPDGSPESTPTLVVSSFREVSQAELRAKVRAREPVIYIDKVVSRAGLCGAREINGLRWRTGKSYPLI
ncbi:hypothetical protein [Maritimibacter sp. 55A14]|uniref:hypothetical protein n=1 Tax=Maritimibacter sp. 55A14 TaxID=2174844 RepID=UPI0011B1D5D0|nr:hypothetical protein [Maritimibacter sp. 55A14]